MTNAIRVFVAFAALTYPFVLLLNLAIMGPSTADNPAAGLAGLATLALWFNLGLAWLLIGIHNGIPWWSWLAGPLVLLICALSSACVPQMLNDHQPVRWMIVVPALGPPLMAAYLGWASIPRYRGLLSANLASVIAWGGLFALMMIPLQRLPSGSPPGQ
jgi:hypothetical protein